ncbi:cation diffusion facilitator family transporter [Ornithinimicrobium pekingense]|uniref:Cobalt transporter n=1 Tax=Ornithinimicrobium pekingense TaxID=384677 RepID=A0ABQ2FCY7_9MICO|nr:cation diffusion facilitator family transporter [Ornithinimicrobium pekingense]GGK76885.1 cobalt transporter [Ornithinimicrobium pekingense]
MSERRRTHFGDTELPEDLQHVLRRARRLEWVTLAFLATAIALLYLVMGSSQAMKAAWLEDMLSLIPPIAFLVGARFAQVRPDRRYPFGRHRSVAVGHLLAGAALVTMGLFLVYDSGSALVKAEHPPIGTMRILGWTVWAGWPMVAVLAYTLVVPVILGRLKLPLAEQLHDKVLYADADMNKADWMTAAGAIVGVLGIGVGLWWLDGVMALLISASILRDGFGNITSAVAGLMDRTAQTVDMTEEHPLVRQVQDYLDSRPWIDRHHTRVRDMGHVFHVEVRFVPAGGRVDLARIDQTVEDLRAMDWKLDDITVAPVRSLREGETQTAR